MTKVIEVLNLRQGYGKTVVLKQINLKIKAGEILALLGGLAVRGGKQL